MSSQFQTCEKCHHKNPNDIFNCEQCQEALPLAGMTVIFSPGMDTQNLDNNLTLVTSDTIDLERTITPDQVSSNQANASSNPVNSHNGMAQFKINDVLGQGGMGAVYRAEDQALQRNVALKLFKSNLSQDSSKAQTLLDEARIACKLNHPNIVTIYDIARGLDTNFIVMEWVNGQSLDKLIPEQGLPLNTALHYAKQIADGLAVAHRNGITHKDIKPQNIMLNKENIIKILDFGIASLLHESNLSAATESNVPIAGTPFYMAPEQLQGNPVDNRTDLFAFGVIFYEMLTGKKPFEAKNLHELKTSILTGDYPALSEIKPETPTEVVELVDKLLTPAINKRWQDSQELSETIEALYQTHTAKKSWWQKQNWLTKAAVIAPFVITLGWSLESIFFPPTAKELIEQHVTEASTIAVLPFDNISGDPYLQLFIDGLTTTLSQDLTTAGLEQGDGTTWVIPTNEIRRMKEPTVKAISDKFGADLILTGSVQHLGSTRSVVLNLLNATDGRQIRTQELTIDANQLFEGQSKVRAEALKLLDWSISDSTIAKFNAEKPQFDGAYKEYIEGKAYYYRHDQIGNIEKAQAALRTAIEIDSSYVNAYALLAESQLLKYIQSPDSKIIDELKNTITSLKKIQPEHYLSKYLMANLLSITGKYHEAIKLYQDSIEINPNYIQAYTGLAKSYEKIKLYKKAETSFNKAISFQPNNIVTLRDFIIFLYYQGKYSDAIRVSKQLADITPNNDYPYKFMAGSYYSLGDIDNAILNNQKALTISPTASAYTNLGTLYFYQGEYDKSVELFKEAIKINPNKYIYWGNIADAYRFSSNADKVNIKEAYLKASVLTKKYLDINPNDSKAKAFLSYYLANYGEHLNALKLAKEFDKSNSGYENFLIATSYDAMKKPEMAIQHLKYAIDSNYSISEIKQTPLLSETRKHYTFPKIIK